MSDITLSSNFSRNIPFGDTITKFQVKILKNYCIGNVTGPPGALLFDVKPEIALEKSL